MKKVVVSVAFLCANIVGSFGFASNYSGTYACGWFSAKVEASPIGSGYDYKVSYSYYAIGSPTPKLVRYDTVGQLKGAGTNVDGQIQVQGYDKSGAFVKGLNGGQFSAVFNPYISAKGALVLKASYPDLFYDNDQPVWSSFNWWPKPLGFDVICPLQ